MQERLGLPGRRATVRWITGDATLETIATVDWSGQRYAVHAFHDFLGALIDVVGADADRADIIAVA